MDWRERIAVDPTILVGKPVIRGTRISVEFVIDLLARGWSVDDILQEYDHLQPEAVRACLLYARDVLVEERVYPTPLGGCEAPPCASSPTRTSRQQWPTLCALRATTWWQ
jgi:uncharacterized protein (DUF433 family)